MMENGLIENGRPLTENLHFFYHMIHRVPVQVYLRHEHDDIGYVENYTNHFVKVNNVYYNRRIYSFISRPGY